MTLNDLLKREKDAILKRWFNFVLETYPSNTATLIKRDKNQFTNPVGAAFSRELEALFKGLLENRKSEEFSASLDSLLKIRSVQDFSPSAAVRFVFLLKKAVQEVLGGRVREDPVPEEWLAFQAKIDDLALLAFDIYVECREKICEIKVNEMRAQRDQAFKLMARNQPVADEP
jgi:hypothetical protein